MQNQNQTPMTKIEDNLPPIWPGPGTDLENRIAARKEIRGPNLENATLRMLLLWCRGQGLEYVEQITDEVVARYEQQRKNPPKTGFEGQADVYEHYSNPQNE